MLRLGIIDGGQGARGKIAATPHQHLRGEFGGGRPPLLRAAQQRINLLAIKGRRSERLESPEIRGHFARLEGVIKRQYIRIGKAHGQRSPHPAHRRVISESGVAEAIHPIKIVVGGVVDAVGSVKNHIERRNAVVLQKHHEVRSSAENAERYSASSSTCYRITANIL